MSARIVRWRFDDTPIVRDGETLADGRILYDLAVDGLSGTLEMSQPFRRGPNPGRVAGMNVWGWDGDRERPSLTPSYVCTLEGSTELELRPIRVHLYMRGGRIDLLSDSTVTLDLENL